ncbi:MAG: ABC transporter ATP-binding protein [Limnochordia bacterium]
MDILFRVLKYFLPYKGLALCTLAFAILSTLAALVPPYLIRVAVDEAISLGNLSLLAQTTLFIFLAYLARDGFDCLRIRFNNTLEQQVIHDMRCQAYNHLQRLSLSFYHERSSGELMSRIVDDINHVERVLLDGTEQVIVALLTLGGVTFLLFRMNWYLALMALIPVPILFVGAILYTRKVHNLYRLVRRYSAAMNSLLHDNLAGLVQIKIFNQEHTEADRFAQRASDYRRGNLKVMFLWSTFSPGMKFIGALGSMLVIWFGGRMVITEPQSGMTLGQLFAFLSYLTLFYEPINRLHAINHMWQHALASSERVFEILDAEPDIKDAPDALDLPRPCRGEVVFEKVSFGYEEGQEVLREIDLQVAPGETLAIVGPTGTGKTTLVNLIPRFYDVESGVLYVDGIDVRKLKLRDLREQIAIVTQDPFLFNTTIRENISYGRPDATEEEIIAAAKSANAHDFIMALPKGYDSRVGEQGVKLSGGEKQRVSIARALLKDAPILILDEATSSVDSITEIQIQEALERLMEGKTTFIIAHRLSTIQEADRIAVIEGGRIVELGTHKELLEQDGLYAQLYHCQGRLLV